MNTFVNGLNEYRKKCDDFFESDKCRQFFDFFGVSEVMKEYYEAFLRQTEGGKRVRAYLTYLGYTICTGEDAEKVLPASLSYELFQTGILAHDDIIDNSETRRFKPSMHMDLGGGHTGISKSICTGDFGIVAANEIVAKSDFPDSIKLKAISHQNKVFVSTIAGELKDIEFSGCNDVPENEIIAMYLLKTAQYTVSGPLLLGAILAGADDETLEKLREFGNLVGVSFQIRDDILGMFASAEKVGKSVTADMCEGKQTVLTAHFMQNASDEQKTEFLSVYGKENASLAELDKARKLLIQAGSLEYAEKLCDSYTKQAKEVIEQLRQADSSKLELIDLLVYMTNRNS